MKILLGSTNPTKVQAVNDAFQHFTLPAEIECREVESGVHDQPQSIEATVQGAINRAMRASDGTNLSIGLESGVQHVELPTIATEFNFCACAIYPAKHIGEFVYLGVSPGFVIPGQVIALMVLQGIEMERAVHESGMSPKKNIGEEEGIIGHMSRGVIPRSAYMQPAVEMALVHLLHDHPESWDLSSIPRPD